VTRATSTPIPVAVVDSILPASLAFELGRAHAPEGRLLQGTRSFPCACQEPHAPGLPEAHPKRVPSAPGPVEQLFRPGS